jgi:hypothetical protein
MVLKGSRDSSAFECNPPVRQRSRENTQPTMDVCRPGTGDSRQVSSQRMRRGGASGSGKIVLLQTPGSAQTPAERFDSETYAYPVTIAGIP